MDDIPYRDIMTAWTYYRNGIK